MNKQQKQIYRHVEELVAKRAPSVLVCSPRSQHVFRIALRIQKKVAFSLSCRYHSISCVGQIVAVTCPGLLGGVSQKKETIGRKRPNIPVIGGPPAN